MEAAFSIVEGMQCMKRFPLGVKAIYTLKTHTWVWNMKRIYAEREFYVKW